MRPIMLTIEGINSFSERQTLNFVDMYGGLFCISGKTGSGKTTILDSILLALYGDAKRNGRLSEYINMGMEKAEVELDFESDGTAYRVKRQFTRANTNKASLTRLDDNTLIAEQPNAVTSAIVSLLGMELNTFTQVVILQQGEFDKFLHASPAERRDTVGKLFRLSRYEKLYSRFNACVETFNSEIAMLETAAAGLKNADDASIATLEKEFAEITAEEKNAKKKLDEANKRRNELEVLKKLYEESEAKRELAGKLAVDCEQLKADLEKLRAKKSENGLKFDLEKMRTDEKEAMLELQRLKGLRPSLKLYSEKKSELEKVRNSYKTINAELKKEKESNELMIKHRAEIAAVLKQTVSSITSGYSSDKYYGKEGFAELKAFISSLKTDVAKAEAIRTNIAEITAEKAEAEKKRNSAALAFRDILAQENDTRIELTRAEEALEDKRRELNDLRSVKALDSVIHTLRIGDNCPVCGNRITFLKTAEESDFDEAEKEIAAAEEKVKFLTDRLASVKAESATIRENASFGEEVLKKCNDKLKELNESLKLTPKTNFKVLDNAEKCCALIDKADPDIARSDHNIEMLGKELRNINERGISLRADIDKLVDSFGEIPPDADIDNLTDIAEAKAARLASDIKNAEKDAEDLNNEISEKEKKLEAEKARLDNISEQLSNRIDYDAAEYLIVSSRCVDAEKNYSELGASRAKKSAELDMARRDAAMLKNLTDRKNKLVKEADCAAKLAKLVKGDAFLDFVAREYVESFTEAASDIMKELSSGQYSLELNEKSDFLIRDFFRNNGLRSVATLSGGETFLASLSMAVAISRELSQYTGNGFFFLDEGFGTLDNDYINIVYEALDKLSRDTMVGLVTHCTELIELVGNGVEIEKADSGSSSKIIGK